MSTPRSPLLSALRRCGVGLAAAVGVLACLAGAGETTSPASRPSPATTRPAGTIAQRMAPTPVEKAIFDAVKDRTDRSDETNLAALVALAGRAPQLEPRDWWDLDRPAYANLVGSPARYRATPLVMRVRVVLVRKLQPGAGLDFPPTWPADRVLWEMSCVEADASREKDKPLRVYSLADPTPLIGQSPEVGDQGRRVYPTGPEIRIAALFYRLLRDEDSSAKQPDCPELVAWQLSKAISPGGVGDWGGGRTGLSKPTWVILLGIGTIVLYYLTKRRLAKSRQSDEKEGDHGTHRRG